MRAVYVKSINYITEIKYNILPMLSNVVNDTIDVCSVPSVISANTYINTLLNTLHKSCSCLKNVR